MLFGEVTVRVARLRSVSWLATKVLEELLELGEYPKDSGFLREAIPSVSNAGLSAKAYWNASV